MIQRTRIFCHECNGNFTAELEMFVNGNQEIACPNCGHVHYRVVENGRVTGDRYRSSMATYIAYGTGWVAVGGFVQVSTGGSTTTSAAGTAIYAQSWSNSSTATTGY